MLIYTGVILLNFNSGETLKNQFFIYYIYMTFCPFSQYSNIFGKPNTGVHSIKFMNVAVFDYTLTIILAFFITYITNIPVELTTIFSFILGIISHILFGVKTNTTKFLHIDCK